MLLGRVRRRSDLRNRQTRKVVEESLLEIGNHSLHCRGESIFLSHLEKLVHGSTHHLVLCHVFFRVHRTCYFGEVCCWYWPWSRKRMMVVLRMYTQPALATGTMRKDCMYIYLLMLGRWKCGMCILVRYMLRMLAADHHRSASSSQRIVLGICRDPV